MRKQTDRVAGLLTSDNLTVDDGSSDCLIQVETRERKEEQMFKNERESVCVQGLFIEKLQQNEEKHKTKETTFSSAAAQTKASKHKEQECVFLQRHTLTLEKQIKKKKEEEDLLEQMRPI